MVNFIDLEEFIGNRGNSQDADDANVTSAILEKLARQENFFNFLSDVQRGVWNKVTSVFQSRNNENTVDNLAGFNISGNRITSTKVSKLSKYSLFLFENNDLLFLNLNAKCKNFCFKV